MGVEHPELEIEIERESDGSYSFQWRFDPNDPRDAKIIEMADRVREVAPFRPSRRGAIWQAIWVGLPIVLADYNEVTK